MTNNVPNLSCYPVQPSYCISHESLPYNDSIKEYLPDMEERWENYYCVTNLERPL